MTEDTKKQPSSVRIQQIDDPLWQIDEPYSNGRARLETGVVRLNDDWPGIFLRGDSAFSLGLYLKTLLESEDAAEIEVAKLNLRGYPELFMECDIRNHKDAKIVHGERDD